MYEVNDQRLLGDGAEDVGQPADMKAGMCHDAEHHETDARPSEDLPGHPVPLVHTGRPSRNRAHDERNRYQRDAWQHHPPVGKRTQVRGAPSRVELPHAGSDEDKGGPWEDRKLRAG